MNSSDIVLLTAARKAILKLDSDKRMEVVTDLIALDEQQAPPIEEEYDGRKYLVSTLPSGYTVIYRPLSGEELIILGRQQGGGSPSDGVAVFGLLPRTPDIDVSG